MRIGDYRPQLLAEALDSLVKLCEEGVLKPRVGAVYPASQLAQAHTHLESRRSSGKIILTWDSTAT